MGNFDEGLLRWNRTIGLFDVTTSELLRGLRSVQKMSAPKYRPGVTNNVPVIVIAGATSV
eukprot:gene33939-38359_t